MRRKLIIIFAAAAIFAAAVAYLKFYAIRQEPGQTSGREYLSAGFSGFTELVAAEWKKAVEVSLPASSAVQVGITSHHLPVAAPFIAQFYRTYQSSAGPRQTFVVIGPDHTEKCPARATTGDWPYQTPFGQLEPDEEVVGKLLESGAEKDNRCLVGEHSVGVQAIFIKLVFPQAKIVPLVLSGSTPEALVDRLAQGLAGFRDRIAVVVSTDFSHYKPYEQSEIVDKKTQAMLEEQNVDGITMQQVDSPASIKLGVKLAKLLGENKTVILGRKNSYDFTGDSENTTSYFNVLFTDTTKSLENK